MKLYVLIITFFLVIGIQSATAVHAVAGGSGKSYSSFIPEGWSVFKSRYSHAKGIVKGDLNGDGVSDLAMILIKPDKNGEEEATRKLVLLFGKRSGGYRLAGTSDTVLRCKQCGGMTPEPFDSLKIKGKNIVIKQSGGSGNNRWNSTHKWQFRNADWYLIGRTDEHNMGHEGFNIYISTDENLITGIRIITKKELNEDTNKFKILSRLKPLKTASLTPINMSSFEREP